MNLTFVFLVLLAIFFVAIGVVHRLTEKHGTKESKSLGVLAIGSALFVVVGSGEYAISLGQINTYGWAGVSFVLGLIVAFLMISRFSNRIFEIRSRETAVYLIDGFINYTTPDFLYTAYGKLISSLASLIVIICFFGLYVLQVYVGGILLSAASGVSVFWSSFLVAATVIVYAMAGGFLSLFRTDTVQAFIMNLALLATGIAALWLHQSSLDLANSVTLLSDRAATNFTAAGISADPSAWAVFFLTVFAAFSGADLWQRVNVAGSPKEARSALRGGAIALLVFAVLLLILSVHALAVFQYAGVIPEDAFTEYLELVTADNAPSAYAWTDIMVAVFSIGLLAAFISTADSCLMLTASATQNELHRWKGSGATEVEVDGPINEQFNKPTVYLLDKVTTWVLVAGFGIAGLALSLGAPNVVDSFLVVLSLLAVLGVPVLATLIGFGSNQLVAASIIIGASLVVYLGYFVPELNTGWNILTPALPGFICFFHKR